MRSSDHRPPLRIPVSALATTGMAVTNPSVPDATTVGPAAGVHGVNVAGKTIGELKIPKIDLDFYIESGTNRAQVNSGIGHDPSTPLPGQLGNAVLVGDRTTHLAPSTTSTI